MKTIAPEVFSRSSGNRLLRPKAEREERKRRRRSDIEVLEARLMLAIDAGLVSGSIAVAGERDRYSFSLSNDAKMYFDALAGGNSLSWSLDGPAGNVVNQRRFSQSDGANITNPVLVLG